MSDYVLQAKIKNGRILRAMREMGIGSAAELTRRIGSNSPNDVGLMINLKKPARNQTGEWSKIALDISDALACDPNDLFSEQQQWMSIEKNDVERFFSYEEIEAALSGGSDPAALLEESSVHSAVNKLMNDKLTDKERRVLTSRLGGATLEACGKAEDVSRERIRQIQHKAIRKLRKSIGQNREDFRDY